MSSVGLGLAIDIFLMICLGMTIYYAMRLSGNLTNFRNSKEELQALIQELSRHIDEAQIAIKNLRISGQESADSLRSLIKESRGLSEELRVINEASDSMANRIEGLAVSRRKGASAQPAAFPDQPSAPPRDFDEGPAQKAQDHDMPSFFIQDREFEDDDIAADDDSDVPEDLGSEAERELFRALKKRRSAR